MSERPLAYRVTRRRSRPSEVHALIGKTVSHYRILELLGEGGMGVVYRAEDTRLGRTVALKFLPTGLTSDPKAKERFVLEARAASSLNHPNICTIHDIDETEDGQMFMCMACYDGETVKETLERGPLPIPQALDIALAVARGLGCAHERGIVHRDIKSANILTTEDGHVTILDFGLAKLKGQADLTTPGTTLGTVTYMSPEQARGEPVDERTDIWALGVVLHEMIAGRPPFDGEHPQAIIRAVLNDAARPLRDACPDAPDELERIISKALAKRPDDRYPSAAAFIEDLEPVRESLRTGSTGPRPSEARPRPSVAVLPFTNMSADPEQEYFCDGMAEEIINVLARLEGLRVVARTSAFAFKDEKLDVREVGRRLDVESVLEGGVRKAGSRVRITAQLISVDDGFHLWSERYDRELMDVFAIQDEIAGAIVDRLKGELLGPDRDALSGHRTRDIEAYTLYLKGRHHWNRRIPAAVEKARECFLQAIERDPDYADAYVGLADSWVVLENFRAVEPEEAFREAAAAVARALAIDGTLAEAYATRGWLKMVAEWDWAGAESDLRRAIELNPSYPSARQWYAVYLLVVGRSSEAIEESRRAEELDPLSPIIGTIVANLLENAGRNEESLAQYNKVLAMDPSFSIARLGLAGSRIRNGDLEGGLAEIEKVVRGAGLDRWRHPAIGRSTRCSVRPTAHSTGWSDRSRGRRCRSSI